MKTHQQRIAALRIMLRKKKLAGFILPVGDEFLSEYPHPSSQRLNWLCGFDGSAGTIAVLDKKAALITDGRYILQAEKQLAGLGIKIINSGEKTITGWLAENMPPKSRLGVDMRLLNVRQHAAMAGILEEQGIELVALAENPVDEIWAERPPQPASAVTPQPINISGRPTSDKLRAVIAAIGREKADGVLITACDSIAWLLNIRASDLPTVPVALSALLVEKSGRLLWAIDESRFNSEAKAEYGTAIEICPPHNFMAQIAKKMRGRTLLIDATLTPAIYGDELEKAGVIIDAGEDPVQRLKAVKNKTELKHIRKWHITDGAALTEFLHWLSRTRKTDELEVAAKLLAYRAANKNFRGVSFDTIAGFNGNGAIVHYRATPDSCRKISSNGILLLDSGGQYPGATTDVTRTIAIGKPSKEQKEAFTRVLKGHIALASTVFPYGTTGSQLDAIARHALWQAGMDYDHGTGHGVGAYLSVHEGPQRISKSSSGIALEAGMILSNEPGYYKTGKFGIRIENLVEVVATKTGRDGRKFMGFNTLTMAPIDLRLTAINMLTRHEKDWLNAYHASVWKALSPLLPPATQKWLKKATGRV